MIEMMKIVTMLIESIENGSKKLILSMRPAPSLLKNSIILRK